MNLFSKLTNVREFPRYLRELPSYVRGVAKAKTLWGDEMLVPFPEFRSICVSGIIDSNEVAVYECLNKLLTKNDVFFDIGANAGFYSLLAASKGAEVHAFEIHPRTYKLLARNARGNMHTYHLGVSDHVGTARIKEGIRPGLTKLAPDGTIPVTTTALDEFGVVPTVMKVDVESHEIPVFKGAERMLKKYMPTIVVEGGPLITAYLTSLGYLYTPLNDNGNDLFRKPGLL